MIFPTILVSALLLLQGAFAAPTNRAAEALTPDLVVKNINVVTKTSSEISTSFQTLYFDSGPGDVAKVGKVCAARSSPHKRHADCP